MSNNIVPYIFITSMMLIKLRVLTSNLGLINHILMTATGLCMYEYVCTHVFPLFCSI